MLYTFTVCFGCALQLTTEEVFVNEDEYMLFEEKQHIKLIHFVLGKNLQRNSYIHSIL